MSNNFFVDWALWQKMVFILGLALVVTIFVGIIKLWYTHWRVRKYAAIEKLADKVQVIREQSIIRSLSTKNVRKPKRDRSTREPMQEKNSVEVPFGIRALEEGTKVDDVWDSRPASREVSSNDLTMYRGKNPSTTDLQQALAHPVERRESSILTSDTESDGDISGLNLNPARDLESGPVSPPPPGGNRSKYPPHSFAKYEGTGGYRVKNSFGPRLNTRLHSSDGPQSSSSAPSFTSTYSPAHSEDASPGADYLQPDLRTGRPLANSAPSSVRSTRSASADSIRAMQQRRLSQCAETGQFLPRHRSERLDLDPESEQPVLETTLSDRLSFEFDEEGRDSDPKHFSTPSIRVTANTPNLDGTPSTPFTSQRGRRLRKRSPTPPSTPVSASFSVSSRRSSEVLRQINSDFAILRPGTLETQPTTPQPSSTSKVRSSSTESG
ncbi:hypothetical protein C1H76_7826 [Elsinoe australis]|uniref:Uncharacterized protein n=1 Tax=Elsinoe australis TaxID=40998 RepID=A0A4V6DTB3_9PEZI|nr:hypothetical protein C1H76_7826 [Elsinoe australis]